MILSLVGALFIVLGLFSGGVLVASPFGVGNLTPSLMLWVLFPLFSLLGYAMFFAGVRSGGGRRLSFAVSVLLLGLATASAVGLVMSAASVVALAGSSLPLWYVLVVAGVLGAVGVGSHQSSTIEA